MTRLNCISANLHDLVARVDTIASLPDVYLRVRGVVDDPTRTHADLAQALGTDPGISARLLRIANSAYYGRSGTVDTLSRAIGLLGIRQVYDLVLATAVMQAFDPIFPCAIKPRQFWEASVLTATSAKSLAKRCHVLEPDRLFVMGLLSQIGHLVLLEALPVQMGAILHLAAEGNDSVCELQRQTIGFDYAQVSATLFERWQLPASLVAPIRNHTVPDLDGDYPLESAILHVAVGIAKAESSLESHARVIHRINESAWTLTGLSSENFETLRESAREQTERLLPDLLAHAA